jgi:Ni,Fe-hydrogenase I small subunit
MLVDKVIIYVKNTETVTIELNEAVKSINVDWASQENPQSIVIVEGAVCTYYYAGFPFYAKVAHGHAQVDKPTDNAGTE